MKILLYLAVALTFQLFSCKTGESTSPVNRFTGCPVKSNCSYLFTEQADVDKAALKSGKYRVFWNTINQELGGCTLQSILWVKAPMDKKEFMLNKEDITNGLVQYSENCACCILLGLKPISGFLKGFNTTPEKKADETKWLIEGEIVLGTIADNRPVDTLKLKQYFYPNFVYD